MPDRVGGLGTGYLFGDGDYVGFTAWPGMRATISGDGWLGIAPGNQNITMRSLDFWRCENGLIRENWVLVDILDVYHQIGVDVFARMRELTHHRQVSTPNSLIITMNDFPIIDAHHHFWDLQMRSHPWLSDSIEPNFFLGDYSRLQEKNYLPEDYRTDCVGFDIRATVHVEAEWERDRQVAETDWLSKLADANDLPSVIVAHAWFHTDNSQEVLAAHASYPLVRGIRSKPVTAPTATSPRPTGPGSMQDPAWRKGLASLLDYGFSWDLRVPCWHLEEAAEVVAELPGLQVVLNHTGFPWDRSAEGLALWEQGMKALVKLPNVCVKLSEFGLKDVEWDYESNKSIVLKTIDMFGPERCMWASNFPVAGLRISYKAQLEALLEMTKDLALHERRAIFHDTAANFYRIDT